MTGEQLKLKRKQKGWTQAQLGARIGVSKNTVGNYEKGGIIPDSKKDILKSVFLVNVEIRNPLQSKEGIISDQLLATAKKKVNPERYILEVVLSKFQPIEITQYLDEKRDRFDNLEEFQILLKNFSRQDDIDDIKQEIATIRKMVEQQLTNK